MAIVVALATAQYVRSDFGKELRFLGDISYFTYLTHFPIQLVLLLATQVGLLKINYSTTGAFVMFLGLVIVISVLTYYLFEKQAQDYLRRVLSKRPAAQLISAPGRKYRTIR